MDARERLPVGQGHAQERERARIGVGGGERCTRIVANKFRGDLTCVGRNAVALVGRAAVTRAVAKPVLGRFDHRGVALLVLRCVHLARANGCPG